MNQFFVVTITLDFKGNNISISLLGIIDNYLKLAEWKLKILLFNNLDVKNVVKSIYREGLYLIH
ncbi:hypothetical protein Ga0061079_101133 [Apibacter mensalis]|uniref:Uncharacterized protein n=1 Tax=Apibacter mensalis TaxID=1586267 RepID=A0A0X3ALR2_9FLAO|nr:hypothetical protein Ga0061079_101133 [Apibacter mensalis]